MTAATVGIVEAGGHRVLLARHGSGPPLLYLHGLCDVHAALPADRATPFLAALAARRHVVAPALPGYSGSDGLENMRDVEDVVFHLVDLLDALSLPAVDVVGHSLGGWMAAELALRRPERVRRLVLVAPVGLHVPGVEVPPVFAAVAPRGVGGFGEARRIFFADPDGAAAVDALPDTMAEEQQLRWFGGLAGAARLGWKAPHFQSRQLARRLGRIGVPTVVVGAEQDVLVPAPAVRAWAGGIPGAEERTLPGTGHAAVLESPQAAETVLGSMGGSV